MSKKNIVHTAKVIQPFYYVIKVVLGDIGKTVYKIGETHVNDKRPQELIKKYSDRRANSAELIKFDKLPIRNGKRMTDSKIRSILLSSNKKFKSADRNELEIQLRETDGINEFVSTTTLLTDDEILAAVQTAIDIAKTKAHGYSAEVRYYTELNYDPTQYHLVDFDILGKIQEQFPDFYASLYNPLDIHPVVLIGQFKPEWILSFAAFKKVVIWHDTCEQQYEYPIKEVTKNITYINTLEDLIDMDLLDPNIIANTPYGKIGALITGRIIDDVDFNEFISLLPIKDMASGGLELCSHIVMSETLVCPPHSFGDADILTHIMRITKAKNKTYNSFKELVADSFVVDKPMIKFMKANTLAAHYAIDNISAFNLNSDISTDFVFHHFDIGSAHTCGLPRCDSDLPKNKWNFEMIDESVDGRLYGVDKVLHFNTPAEKLNFTKFVKANRNFINRMIANQFITIRTTTACFPKVDWSKADWTVEKILKEVADYTDVEIAAVIDTMNEDYFVKDDESIDRLFGKYLRGEA